MDKFKAKVIHQKLKKENVQKVLYKKLSDNGIVIFILYTYKDLVLTASCYQRPEEYEQISLEEAYMSLIEDIEYINEKIQENIYRLEREINPQINKALAREITYMVDDQITVLKKIKTKNQKIVGFDWEKDLETLVGEVNNLVSAGLRPLEIYKKAIENRAYDPKQLLNIVEQNDWYDIKDIDHAKMIKRKKELSEH